MKQKIFFTLLCMFLLFSGRVAAQERQVIDLSGEGWLLWQDKTARWESEDIQISLEDALRQPIPSPTSGWEVLTSAQALQVRVPGTAEEYLQTLSGPEGDIAGVTWWNRTIDIPAVKKGEKIVLDFRSIRSRAEVFIDRQLVGYQIVDNVPFEVDVTPYVKSGAKMQLAIRITDAGGNHDWRDSKTIPWGKKMLPPGHGFGGITGNVALKVYPAVYIADIYMQNTPQMTAVNALLTLENGQKASKQDLRITVCEWKDREKIVFAKEMKSVRLQPGANVVEVPIAPNDVKLWSVETPNLYMCEVELLHGKKTVDRDTRRFGFRWFEASGIGQDALFRLNGKRIMLRSAISWGFWPVNGLFPSDELAERQIRIAKELGLNMLNFHRFMGNENVLNYADELGLLYFEEPGGFRLDVNQPFMNAVLKEKVVSMVKRDRSHPSLVIFNLMNESGPAAPEKLELELQTIKEVQRLDPSRTVLRTSAWAKGDDIDDQAKIHARPYDENIYWNGWYDYHRAGGPAVWNEDLYKGPDDYYNNTKNRREIVFFGEEGALSSPPRLERNKEDLDKYAYKGWDGREFLRWYEEFDKYLDEKNLRTVYPTVDDLCVAMGNVSFEHQGRKIESARLNNLTDAYVVNGWESELTENYSGIVDCFRYPKSNPEIIARYNRPLFVAVKTRQQVAAAGGEITVDFYLINEENVRGTHQLEITITDSNGKQTPVKTETVQASGGEVYGELLAEGVKVKLPDVGGLCRIEARLCQGNAAVATGYDDVLSVNLASNVLNGKGAVWEDGNGLQTFLKGKTKETVLPYADALGKLDWVLVARPPKQDQLTMVPMEALRAANGQPGLDAVYYEDMDFQKEVYREVVKVINLSAIEGATPSPFVHMLDRYGIKWTGRVLPPVSGEYTFIPQSNNRSMIEVLVGGQKIYETGQSRQRSANHETVPTDGKIYLEGGKAVDIEIRFKHPRSNARCRLDWAVPNNNLPNPQQLMERAANDGTRIFILQSANEWSEFIAANSGAVFKENFFVGTNWLGGVMFNKPHAIFNELPVGSALNWPYQALIHTGVERMGLVMEGEELLVGAYHTYPMALGTAMGIVPMGKGTVLFSTLDIYGNIINETAAGLVAGKLIYNMIDFE